MARAAGNTAPSFGVGKAIPSVLVALVGALCMVLFHPIVGLPIAGIALATLAFGGHRWMAIGVGLLGGALAAAFAATVAGYVIGFPLVGVPVTARAPYVYAELLMASLVLAGPVTAGMMRRRSAQQTGIILAIALTVLQVAALASLAAGAGRSVNAYASAAIRAIVEQAGMGADIAKAIVSMWPGVLVTMNGFTALLLITGVGAAGIALRVPIRRPLVLAVLDLDPRMVVLPIAAIGAMAVGRLPIAAAPTFDLVGQNLLTVARWVFFLQGLAVFAGLYERLKLARPGRAIGFALLGVSEAFLPVVSLLGLADIWLNMRRLPRDTSATELPGAAPDAD